MCAPAILAGIRTSHFALRFLVLRDTTDCFALRAPAILAGIRTPRIFLTENGCVLMSVRVSRTYPLLQQVEEWVIL